MINSSTFAVGCLLAATSSAISLQSMSPSALETILAQVDQDDSQTHNCLFTAKRNKTAVVDYEKIQEKGEEFTDDTFPFSDALYWPADGEESEDLQNFSEKDYWHSAKAMYPDLGLYGENGITPSDVRQGMLDDGWIMAAIAAVAEDPERIKKIFNGHGNEQNDAGIYALELYQLGVPITVVIDDKLVIEPNDDAQIGKGLTKLSHHGEDDWSLWVPLLQKAMAKVFGNFNHLQGGYPNDAVNYLNGSPWDFYEPHFMEVNDIYDLISKEGTIITAQARGDNQEVLPFNKQYTVLGTVDLALDDNGTTFSLIKLRSPTSREEYSGDWRDDDDRWSDDLREQAGMESKDDGVFFMPIETFKKAIWAFWVQYDTSEWHQDYFLAIDDNSCPDGQESCDFVEHELQVYSEVEQDVRVMVQTWSARTLSSECQSQYGEAEHQWSPSEGEGKFRNGQIMQQTISMGADETRTFKLKLDLSDDSLPGDWSFVAWGEEGAVEVTDKNKSRSDHFPTLKDTQDEAAFIELVESYDKDHGQICQFNVLEDNLDDSLILTSYLYGKCPEDWMVKVEITHSKDAWEDVEFEYQGFQPKTCEEVKESYSKEGARQIIFVDAGDVTCTYYIDAKSPRTAYQMPPGAEKIKDYSHKIAKKPE